MSVTPKMHAISFELEDFCVNIKILLGFYTDQIVESELALFYMWNCLL